MYMILLYVQTDKLYSGVRGVLVTVQAAQQAQEDRILQHSLPALLLDADELAEHTLDGRARHLGQGHSHAEFGIIIITVRLIITYSSTNATVNFKPGRRLGCFMMG